MNARPVAIPLLHKGLGAKHHLLGANACKTRCSRWCRVYLVDTKSHNTSTDSAAASGYSKIHSVPVLGGGGGQEECFCRKFIA